MLSFSLLVGLAFAVDPPDLTVAGAIQDGSLDVQVTELGLQSVTAILPLLVPAGPIAVDDVGSSSFGIRNIKVYPEISSTEITPGQGVLNVAIDLDVALNSNADKFLVDYDAWIASGTCPGYIRSFPVQATLPLSLVVVTDPVSGDPIYDVTAGTLVVVNGLQSQHLELGCSISTINSVLNLFGLDLIQYLIDFANDFLISYVEDQVPTIETTIEEALNSARFDDVVDVSGIPLSVLLQPYDVNITPSGMSLGFSSRFSAPVSECVAQYDQGGSLRTNSPRPLLSANPNGTEMVAHISDELPNQAMYSLWRGGLLCQTIEGGEFAGLSVDTSMLGLLAGDGFNELFPTPSALTIKTVPRTPITVDWNQSNDVTAKIRDFDLEFFAELDGRQANVLGVTATADVGADVKFNPNTGAMAIDLDLSRGFNPKLNGDKLVKDPAEEIEANLSGAIDGLVGTLLDSLLGDTLAFNLPGIAIDPESPPIGVTNMIVNPTGQTADWGGVFLKIGEVPYGDGGCDSTGCSSSSGGGCDAASGGMALGWMAGLLLLVSRRRRA